jgi:transmembrane sensor
MSEQIYITIAKTLSGEATDAEKKELQNWLAADEAHVAEYEELTGFWQKTDDMLQQPVFNTTAAWQKVAAKTVNIPLQQEIKEEVKQTKTIAFPSWAKMSLAAAAALLIGLFVFRQVSGPDMIVAKAENGNKEVVLPDNSHITLREGSTLTYPEAFAANERHVELEGEAFFDVTRNEQKPFIIDAQSATVQVLGTSFDVKADEHMATVVVATGKVKMSLRKDANKALILTPGEKGSLKNGELQEELVNTEDYLHWKSNTIKFKNKPFIDALSELGELYKTDIKTNLSESKKQDPVTATYERDKVTLEEILDELCQVMKCRWVKEGDTYIINPKG